jgi:hypothetical protein
MQTHAQMLNSDFGKLVNLYRSNRDFFKAETIEQEGKRKMLETAHKLSEVAT